MMKEAENGFGAAPLKIYIAGILIALIVFAVYSPALNYGYVYVDDDEYFVKNLHIRSIDADFIKWAFTSFEAANWHPLTWFSLAADYALWGLNPSGFHLQSILLHCFSVFLLTVLIFKLFLIYGKTHDGSTHPGGSALMPAALAAIIFGLHPLRVESVVWITERKEVLCAFFYILSIFLYMSYAARRDEKARGKYILSVTAALFAMMSKPMAVSLPFAILIMDAFILKRFELRRPSYVMRALKDKVPYILFALACSVATFAAQRSAGAVRTLGEVPLSHRVLNAFHSVWFYIQKTFLPTGLAPFYPFDKEISLSQPHILFALIFFIMVSSYCVIAFHKGKDYWPGAWAYYLITLFPVLGIVQVGIQRAGDRFSYIPAVSLSILIGAGLWQAVVRIFPNLSQKHLNIAGALFCAPILLILITATSLQLPVWSDALIFADRVVESSPYAAKPYSDRGFVRLGKGEFSYAFQDCSRALEIEHDSPDGLICRAEASEGMGDYMAAIADYNSFLRINPVNPDALDKRGRAYLKLGNLSQAKIDFALRDAVLAQMRK